MLRRLRLLISGLFRRDRFEAGMADEIQFHIQARAGDLARSGLSEHEALRRARLEFGGTETVKEHCRQARGLAVFDASVQNVRFAVRTMARAPVLSAAAIVSLALGIGVNAALFGFVDAVFLRTLPIQDPHALYYLGHNPGLRTTANYPLFERYRESGVFEDVAAYTVGQFSVATSEGIEPVTGQYSTANYHAVAGVPLARGHGFSGGHDRGPAEPIAVISDGYWTRHFGRSPSVIGSTLDVNGRRVEIVGITEPGFYGLDSERRVDVTLPFSMMALDAPGFFDNHDGWGPLWTIARLKAGTTEAAALAAADIVFRNFMSEPEQQWVRAGPMADRFQHAALLPAARGSDNRRERTALPFQVLVAMAGILLLITCANVANLLLARVASRRREVGVRVSIGASRTRLLGQFLTEGVLLALCGGALGLLVASWTSRSVLVLLDAGPTPFLLDVTLSLRVLAFSVAVSTLAGMGFAIVPALKAARVDPATALKASGAGTAPRHRGNARQLLVASQIALCVLLLVSAALLGRSLWNLRSFDTGFSRESILLADVNTMGPDFSPGSRMALYESALERLRQLPGVRSVSLSTRTPVDGSSRLNRIYLPGRDAQLDAVSPNIVAPDYFSVFGIDIVAGRGLGREDRAETRNVAVVSERMARMYFGAENPIGRTFVMGGSQDTMTIVGVVADVHHERLREEPPPMVYMSLAQTPALTSVERASEVPDRVTLAVHATGNARTIAGAISNELRTVGPQAMVTYVRSMNEQLDAALVRERLLAVLSAAFSGVALLLACIGLYGTLSYHVARRSREIAIRMALGAARAAVLRQVMREGLMTAALGVAAGGIAAIWATGLIASFLFGLSARDPGTLLAVMAILLVTALAAGYIPAQRAAGLDPAGVLKAE